MRAAATIAKDMNVAIELRPDGSIMIAPARPGEEGRSYFLDWVREKPENAFDDAKAQGQLLEDTQTPRSRQKATTPPVPNPWAKTKKRRGDSK